MKKSYEAETTGIGFALGAAAIVVVLLVSQGVTPGVNGLQVAYALQQETQGCTGPFAPPAIADSSTWNQMLGPSFFVDFALTALSSDGGFTVNSVNVAGFTQTASSLQVKGFGLNATYDQYNETVSLLVGVGSLSLERNATTLTGSLSAFYELLTAQQGNQTLRLDSADPGLQYFAWSCTEAPA